MQKILLVLSLTCFMKASCQTGTERSSEVKMTPDNEPGKPFTLQLVVMDFATRQPVKEAEIFAYHTNHKGDYLNDANGIARIHGTAYSDDKGGLSFITIYPRGYNNSSTGEHIHFRVKAKGYSAGNADLSFWDYYNKRYDLNNPVAYKVYLHSLEERDGRLIGKAILYLQKL